MNSLPLFVYTAVRSGEPLYIVRGFGAAAVLLTIVLVLFVIVRILARQRQAMTALDRRSDSSCPRRPARTVACAAVAGRALLAAASR